MKITTLAVSFFTLGFAAVSAYPGSHIPVVDVRSRSLDARAWEGVEDSLGHPGSYIPVVDVLDAQAWEEVEGIFHQVDMWDEDVRDYFLREISARHDAELEARGAGGVIDVAVDVVSKVFSAVTGAINSDKERRSELTKKMISELRAADPSYLYIVCYVKHSFHFNGNKGTDSKADWKESEHTFKPHFKLTKKIKYKIYSVRKGGTFHREGDGGWLNWAYSGGIKRVNANDLEIPSMAK